MIHQSLDADSAYAAVALNREGLASLQYRDAAGSATREIESNVSSPHRLRIEKRGDFVYAFLASVARSASHSDEPLRPSGLSIMLPLHGSLYIGIGVCSCNKKNKNKEPIAKVVFSNVELATPVVSAVAPVPFSTLGSNWFDMAEHVTRLRVNPLCADLQTFHRIRKQPKHAVKTFANKILGPDDYIETAAQTEDFGAVIFHMGARARGSVTASRVSAGRKNRLSIEIYGTQSSVAWDQERPDELWAGHRDAANQILLKDPSLLSPGARSCAHLPGGHSEGYDDTFKLLFRRFYASIGETSIGTPSTCAPGAMPVYPQFVDGLRQLTILNAVLYSHWAREAGSPFLRLKPSIERNPC